MAEKYRCREVAEKGSAFRLLIDSERDAGMKALLDRLYAEVVGGAALCQAMAGCGAFGPLDEGVIRIGDETGHLTEALDFLHGYCRKRREQKRMVSAVGSYPIVILCTAMAVVAFMLAVVVPMFEQVYARMGGELPRLTQAVIAWLTSLSRYAVARRSNLTPLECRFIISAIFRPTHIFVTRV